MTDHDIVERFVSVDGVEVLCRCGWLGGKARHDLHRVCELGLENVAEIRRHLEGVPSTHDAERRPPPGRRRPQDQEVQAPDEPL